MNYKIGDKVRVKTNLKDFATYGYAGFAPSMRSYCGGIFEIAGLCANFYYLKNCGDWRVSDEMLEPTYTLQECIDKNYAIHCDTEDKANKLMKALDNEGYKWKCGSKYTFCNYFFDYGKETCYTPYEGMYDNTSFYKEHNIKIVWFDDVVLPKDCKCEQASVLDEAEKAYLEAVLKPFKDRVNQIIKTTSLARKKSFFIEVKLNDCSIFFPPFSTKMYVGMKPDEPYTLKELGLFR